MDNLRKRSVVNTYEMGDMPSSSDKAQHRFTATTSELSSDDKPMDHKRLSVLAAEDRRVSIATIEAARVTEIDDRNGQFHRSFTPRQVHVSTYPVVYPLCQWLIYYRSYLWVLTSEVVCSLVLVKL